MPSGDFGIENPEMKRRGRSANLRPRLASALGLLTQADVLADVGCDHGYFSIAALRSGAAKRVIASDISSSSLEKAVRTASQSGLSERILFRCCDGLSGFAEGEAQTAALLGMGGELIASILEKAPAVAHAFERIVMQPMRGEPELRRYLYESGYRILDETVVLDSGRWYQLIAAKFEPGFTMRLPIGWPENYYQFGPCAFFKREPELLLMMQRYLSIIEEKLAEAEAKGSAPAALLREAECTKQLIESFPKANAVEDRNGT